MPWVEAFLFIITPLLAIVTIGAIIVWVYDFIERKF